MIHMWLNLKHTKKVITLFLLCCIVSTAGTACGNAKINAREESEKIINTYYVYGDYDTTLRKMEELLEQVKRQEGDNSKDEIMALLSLGGTYCVFQEYDKAEPYILEAKNICDKIMLDESPIEILYNELAQLSNSKENYEQGLEYLKEELMWTEKIYGKESQESSYVNYKIGESYYKMSKLEEAEVYIIKGLDAEYDGIQEMAYITGYHSLGEIKLKQKKYEEALENLEEARVNYLRITAGKPTEELTFTLLLPIYSDMADAYIGLGNYETAMYSILRGYGSIANVSDYVEIDAEFKDAYINKIFDIWKILNGNESRSEFDSWLANDAMY